MAWISPDFKAKEIQQTRRYRAFHVLQDPKELLGWFSGIIEKQEIFQ